MNSEHLGDVVSPRCFCCAGKCATGHARADSLVERLTDRDGDMSAIALMNRDGAPTQTRLRLPLIAGGFHRSATFDHVSPICRHAAVGRFICGFQRAGDIPVVREKQRHLGN